LFATFIRQKTRRYIEKNGVDGFDRPGYRAYFTHMTRQLHSRGYVHLSGLEVGGELVATHWGIVANRRFYCLMLAYEACMAAQYSAARLLVEDLIQWSFAHGLDAFDLGFGHADWKLKLGAAHHPLMLYEKAARPLGWAYLNARSLRDRLASPQQNAASRVPPRGAVDTAPVEAA
jgi:CelD/BcsL family acetyltransferase involved in cellulose biosynthesis